MKILRLFLCISFCLIALNGHANDCKSALNMVKRLTPQYADKFLFKQIRTLPGEDVFELSSIKGKILIKGNNANSMAVGFNYYLKYYCYTTISWYAHDTIEMPSILPEVPETVSITSRVANRFFLNYCTFGYSMPWWKWEQWEHFIDWMALNGVNMPLAITGQEKILYTIWSKLGMSDQEIRSYFTGPAHLPWNLMANLDNLQGPLPINWINGQSQLQKKIVRRERELGMKPILMAYAGHIPEKMKALYPTANITKSKGWAQLDEKYLTHFLSPADPLFKTIQKMYIEEQTKLYGTDHLYAADPFNEMEPPSWEPDYLSGVSKGMYQTIAHADKKAVWVQMSWLFNHKRDLWTLPRIEGFLSGVPNGKMIMLDFQAEYDEIWKRTNAFYGHAYFWCYLGNFGGNTLIAGNLKAAENKIEKTFAKGGDNFSGLGSTLEGLDVNPFIHESIFEKAWNIPQREQQWRNTLAQRRLGAHNTSAKEAWDILLDKIYITSSRSGATLTNTRPLLKGYGNWPTNSKIDYDNKDLVKAWGLLLQAKNHRNSSYLFDIVNIGRQVLGNYFYVLREDFRKAYEAKDIQQLNIVGKQMEDLLTDMDSLLATHPSFLLGAWLEEARSWGQNQQEADYYEKNARTILTTWSYKDQHLNDYGNRSWAGLTKGYYKPRWVKFTQDVIRAVENGQSFDNRHFYSEITSFEDKWISTNEKYTTQTEGDPYTTASLLFQKYNQPIIGKPTLGQQAMIDRKYGMFITFGINTYIDKEWSDGSHPASCYTPPANLAEQAANWVKQAKEAGMRSVLLTTKHHDGFCLWESKYTNHDIGNPSIEHKIDVVKAVSDACHKYGLSFTVYYSLWDRHEPCYKMEDKRLYIEFMKNQLKELFTNYGKIGELWFDGAWDRKTEDWYLPEIYAFIKGMQPDCQISTNWTIGRQNLPVDMKEGFEIAYFPSDFRLYDPHLPAVNDPKIYTHNGQKYYLPFECTQTISILGNWYHHDSDTTVRDLQDLEEIFYRTTVNDNCLLLNIPPGRNGKMNPVATGRIMELARLLSIENGKPFPLKLQKPQSLTSSASAEVSSIYENDTLHFGPHKIIDGDVSTAWKCNDKTGWFIIELHKEASFKEMAIIEGGNNVKQFLIEAEQNGMWQQIYKGQALSNENIGSFMGYGYGEIHLPAPVKTKKIRIAILESKNNPSIYSLRIK